MQLFSSLLFGVSASLDALLLGITYGIRRIHIRLWQNLLISFITLLGTCLSVGFGSWLSSRIPPSKGGIFPKNFPLGKQIGSATLMLLGIYLLLKFMIPLCKRYLHNLRLKGKTGEIDLSASSRDTGNDLVPTPESASLRSVLFLGVALSANNIGIGLGASMAGLSLAPAAVTTFLFSAVFLALGNRLGRSSLSELLGKAADPVSGLLLLGLGVCELFF